FLAIFSDERLRARSADVIRGLVEVAVAAQQQRTQSGFFRAGRDRLTPLGLTPPPLGIAGGNFRFSPLLPAMDPGGEELRRLLQGWRPLSQIPVDVMRTEGTLVEDLPAFLAQLSGLPKEGFHKRVASRAVGAAIRIGGVPGFLITCSGEDLDSAVASGFALL